MKRFYCFLALHCLIFEIAGLSVGYSQQDFGMVTVPFNACTAYAPPFVLQSFAVTLVFLHFWGVYRG